MSETLNTPNIEQTSYPVEVNSTPSMIMAFYNEALTTGISDEQLKLYIKYPMRYNQQIRRLSREMYGFNGLYSNTVDYMVSAPSLAFITRCFENNEASKKKQKLFNKMLRKINHKLTTRDILLSLLLDGIYVGMFRNTEPKKVDETLPSNIDNGEMLEGLTIDSSLMIQPLYVDYIKILGFQNNDYVVAYDMRYFDQFKTNGLLGELKNFPPEFAKGYYEYRRTGNYWFRLDQSKTVVLKLKSNIKEPLGRPLCISALNDMFFSDSYTDGLRANLSESASNIRWLKQPMGEKQGQCSLNKDQQQAQYDNFKNAVFSNSTSKRVGKTTTLVLAPGTEVGKLEVNTEILKDTLTNENRTNISTDLGFASAALNGTGEGGASYSSLQVNIDLVLTQVFAILEQVAYQYTKVFNNAFSGGRDVVEIIYLKTSSLTKERDVTNAKELYTLGGGSRLYWIACMGEDIDVYMSLMDYEKSEDFDSKYPPHAISFTTPGGDANDGGRPNNSNPTNDNTIKSKTNGSNKVPKPSSK
jgi:hypothetical protein